jgi:hypothetical protein
MFMGTEVERLAVLGKAASVGWRNTGRVFSMCQEIWLSFIGDYHNDAVHKCLRIVKNHSVLYIKYALNYRSFDFQSKMSLFMLTNENLSLFRDFIRST